MVDTARDHELVTAYATEGSEAAFRALVARHVDLVYATAVRQVGDPGLAQEVTQNVFVALARKAPRLGGVETLAGWLHRAAILEAKARIRSELRRRRREEVVAASAHCDHGAAAPFEALMPLLDEALLHLREGDRLALVLRFLEDRSLREVGTALGVDEDAARKRVSRALHRLGDYFRRQGFAVPAGAGCIAVLTQATQAAPSSLLLTASQAGLAAGGAASGLNLLWLKLMTLGKTQSAILAALLTAAPLTWQWRAEARTAREQADLRARLEAGLQEAERLENDMRALRDALLRTQAEADNAGLRLAELRGQLDPNASRLRYQWDDASPVLRVPKAFLDRVSIAAVGNKRGQMTDLIQSVLQMTASESRRAQAALDRFLADYHVAQAQRLQRVEPTDQDLAGHAREATRVFEVPRLGNRFGELRAALWTELQETLGPERFERLRKGLEPWMQVDEASGLSSERVVVDEDWRVRFYRPDFGECELGWSVRSSAGHQLFLKILPEDIPDFYRAHLQDWLDLAESHRTATRGEPR